MDASNLPSLSGASWLTGSEARAVFAALGSAGFAARAVGGAVRNALLSRPVTDVDIATTARPEDVVRAATAAGLKAVPTGIAHGTVTVVSGGRAFEVTTLRKDVETFGRHANVAFTDDWTADARRRDFTINALYCSGDGEVFDPLGGYADLAARRVRFIGDAAERIREDYLRILRFFRLAAEYGEGAPNAAGLAACVRERAGLALLSAERVRQEMVRLLEARRASELVDVMCGYGLITQVLPAVPRPGLLARLAAVEAGLGLQPDAILRLAALAVELPEDADRLRARWRLSNEETATLQRAVSRGRDVAPAASERQARQRLYLDGPKNYHAQVLMAWARSGDAPADNEWRERFGLPERWKAPQFPVGGDDVIALGVAPGPRVGVLLGHLEQWWIAGDFAADAAALRVKLKELIGTAHE